MKVSFGGTYFVNEKSGITRNQRCINFLIKSAFAQEEDYYTSYSDKSKTVEKLLEEKKGADILVKNKADGTVDLEVICRYFNDDFDDVHMLAHNGYVPYALNGKSRLQKKNIKLNENIDIRSSIKKVQKSLDNFALKCRAYAMASDTEKNNLLAEKHEILLEKELAELERKGYFRDKF